MPGGGRENTKGCRQGNSGKTSSFPKSPWLSGAPQDHLTSDSLAHVFNAFSSTMAPAPSLSGGAKQKKSVNSRRSVVPCGRHRRLYAASARCGKALNGANCCHGYHILFHTVVLHFCCPCSHAVSVSSDLITLENMVQGDWFSQRKTYWSHCRVGDSREARALPAPGDGLCSQAGTWAPAQAGDSVFANSAAITASPLGLAKG